MAASCQSPEAVAGSAKPSADPGANLYATKWRKVLRRDFGRAELNVGRHQRLLSPPVDSRQHDDRPGPCDAEHVAEPRRAHRVKHVRHVTDGSATERVAGGDTCGIVEQRIWSANRQPRLVDSGLEAEDIEGASVVQDPRRFLKPNLQCVRAPFEDADLDRGGRVAPIVDDALGMGSELGCFPTCQW